MSGLSVIVFGARGAVGRAAALEAHERGAHVYLAMRDPTQTIQGIDTDAPRFTRVQADLTDVASVKKAVTESKAKAAFTYTIFGQVEAVRPSFVAMKEAGITHVVLLSSFSVQPDVETALAGTHPIAHFHALFEKALTEVGLGMTAVRPAYFTSNLFFSGEALKTGEIPIFKPYAKCDFLAPESTGTVAGARLVAAAQAGPAFKSEVIPLCGPELIPLTEAWEIAGKVLGRKFTIKELTREEFVASVRFPPPVANAVAETMESIADNSDSYYPPEIYPEPYATNVKRYTGKDPVRLPVWIEKHRDDPRWYN